VHLPLLAPCSFGRACCACFYSGWFSSLSFFYFVLPFVPLVCDSFLFAATQGLHTEVSLTFFCLLVAPPGTTYSWRSPLRTYTFRGLGGVGVRVSPRHSTLTLANFYSSALLWCRFVTLGAVGLSSRFSSHSFPNRNRFAHICFFRLYF